jgi:hypothetical protein
MGRVKPECQVRLKAYHAASESSCASTGVPANDGSATRSSTSSSSRTDPRTCASTYSSIAPAEPVGEDLRRGVGGQQAHEAGDIELRGPG